MTAIPTDRPIRILIVDDDRDFAKGFLNLLKEEGFEPHAEFNGKEALKLFQEKSFEVAFVDGLLPGMDGFELVREFRWIKHGERMPVVMMSGVYRASTHAREAMEKYRLADYLEKPVKASVIIQTLRKIFGRDYPKPEPLTVAAEAGEDTASARPRRVVNTYYLYQQSDMPLIGNLKDTPLPVLLNQIFERKLTGQLMIMQGRAKKLIMLKNGRPISISSNIINECLGRILLHEGEINEEDYNRTLQAMKSTGRRHGECLLQAGVIDSLQLSQALKLQFEQKLYSMFKWTNAQYSFKAKDSVPAPPVDIDTHPYTMIRDGLRKHSDPHHIRDWLKPYLSSPLEASENYQERMNQGGFNLKEIRFVGNLDGKEPMEDVMVNPLKTRMGMVPFMMTLIVIDAVRVEQPLRVETPENDRDLRTEERSVLQAQIDQHLHREEPQSTEATIRSRDKGPSSSRAKVEKMEMMQALQQLNEDQQAFYKKLYAMRETIREKDYFEFFGVERESEPGAVKPKFLKLAKEYHPDAIPHQDVVAIRKLADEVFTELSTAHETLTNKKKRKEYIEFLDGGGTEDATEAVAKVLAAEQHFHSGQAALRKKDWAGAKRSLQEALKLNPNEGEYYAELGWAHFNLSPRDLVSRQEAEKYLRKAIELAPKLPAPHIYLGSIYKILGDVPTAAQNFAAALEVDPKNARAKSEIRLLKMRKKEELANKGKKSLFGGLFGKK